MAGTGPSFEVLLGSVGDGSAGLAPDVALDEVLVRREIPAARVWRPLASAAVLGVASPFRSELHLENCAKASLPILRRATGGGAVLLAPGVVCFGVVLPHETFPDAAGISGAYRLACAYLKTGLARFGLDVTFEPPGDLAVSGRKLVGLAQARRRRATLVHGVVPVSLEIEEVERYVAHPPSEPAYRRGRPHREFMTTLAREACRATAEELVESLAAAFSGGSAPRREPTPELAEEAARLAADKFNRDEWIFRR